MKKNFGNFLIKNVGKGNQKCKNILHMWKNKVFSPI